MNEQQTAVLRQALRDLILEYCMERSSFAKRVDEIFKQALAQPAAIPKGYKLVPDTPTNEMTSAMADALEDPENERSSWDLAENMYRAMLASAPQQQGDTP